MTKTLADLENEVEVEERAVVIGEADIGRPKHRRTGQQKVFRVPHVVTRKDKGPLRQVDRVACRNEPGQRHT
jgi:hypothetical protein